jgi:16S rRNA (guanine1516-N2)-methyltransferase
MNSENKIAITASCDSMLIKAKELAGQLNLPFVYHDQIFYPFLLMVTPERLELREMRVKNSKSIYVDFLGSSLNYRVKSGGGNKQLIAKAVGIKSGFRPTVLDATAGFGVDAFVLASLGCEVVMLERSLVISALLQDGLDRFRKEISVKNIKISLHISQSIDYLSKIFCGKIQKPDVIYFDPMYPKRQKSALGKKTMRILHELVGDDEDAAEVFALALKCAKKRVIVKRPSYAPGLGIIQPDLKFSAGGSCRYDVYFLGGSHASNHD